MVVRAAAAGWRVVEVDVDYAVRIGTSEVAGSIGGTLRAASDMRKVLPGAAADRAR